MASPYSNYVGYSNVSLSGTYYIDALVEGVKWGGGLGTGVTLPYSFPSETGSSWWDTGYGFGELNNFYGGPDATERAAAISALGKWANVANITFTQTTDTDTNVGEIRFAWTDEGVGEQAHAYYPGGTPEAGDVWLNISATWTGWGAGQYPYLTLLHELGHALGLKHSFEDGTIMPAAYDGYHFTIMSYTTWAEDPPNANSSASFYPTTPMIDDIAAIQYLYGKNTSYNSGNTTYTFNQGQTYFQTIWDGGGNDTIVWTGTTQSCEIDLRSGYWSGLGNDITFYNTNSGTINTNYNVTIAFGAIIENATGGAVGDLLEGNNAANILTGNGGNDTLNGYGGNDTLNGGPGNDTMKGGPGNDIYLINSTGDKAVELSGQGSDLVKASISYTLGGYVEKLTLTGSNAINGTGNALANVLTGNAAANNLSGGGGNDTLKGNGGNDKLNGGLGNDTLFGGAGKDTLTGGGGKDFFVFNTTLGISNIDTITDYSTADDTIRLENGIFTKLTTLGTLSTANFKVGTSAGDNNDYIVYTKSTGELFYDADGSGAGAAIKFAVVTAGLSLNAAEFVVI